MMNLSKQQINKKQQDGNLENAQFPGQSGEFAYPHFRGLQLTLYIKIFDN